MSGAPPQWQPIDDARLTFWIDFLTPTGCFEWVDHLCSNKRCVNPMHLEAVTKAENVLRGQKNRKPGPYKPFCPRGHLKVKKGKFWTCPTCDRAKQQTYRKRRNQGLVGVGTGYHQRQKTHCPNGHEYTPENTLWRGRWRRCRECHRIREHERYLRSRSDQSRETSS